MVIHCCHTCNISSFNKIEAITNSLIFWTIIGYKFTMSQAQTCLLHLWWQEWKETIFCKSDRTNTVVHSSLQPGIVIYKHIYIKSNLFFFPFLIKLWQPLATPLPQTFLLYYYSSNTYSIVGDQSQTISSSDRMLPFLINNVFS